MQIVHSIQLKNHPALDNAPYCGSISRPKTKARIQGGAKTKHDSFPSFIFLSMRQMVRGNIDEKECGSVLIGKRYLLTSASCLMRPDMRRKITSGTAWITNQKAERKGSFTGIGISIQAFCVPASYRRDPYNKLYYDDVAVVKLSENLVFNSTVLPACISKTRCSNCSSNYKLPGFGRTLDYPRLQRLDLDDPISVRKSRKSRAGRDLKYIDLTELDCEEPFNSEFLCLAATDMTQSSSAACKGKFAIATSTSHGLLSKLTLILSHQCLRRRRWTSYSVGKRSQLCARYCNRSTG